VAYPVKKLEYLGDDDRTRTLGPLFEEKTFDRFWFKTKPLSEYGSTAISSSQRSSSSLRYHKVNQKGITRKVILQYDGNYTIGTRNYNIHIQLYNTSSHSRNLRKSFLSKLIVVVG